MVPGVKEGSSHALMGDASQSGGNVTMITIVGMAAMSWKVCVVSILITVLESDTGLSPAPTDISGTFPIGLVAVGLSHVVVIRSGLLPAL